MLQIAFDVGTGFLVELTEGSVVIGSTKADIQGAHLGTWTVTYSRDQVGTSDLTITVTAIVRSRDGSFSKFFTGSYQTGKPHVPFVNLHNLYGKLMQDEKMTLTKDIDLSKDIAMQLVTQVGAEISTDKAKIIASQLTGGETASEGETLHEGVKYTKGSDIHWQWPNPNGKIEFEGFGG